MNSLVILEPTLERNKKREKEKLIFFVVVLFSVVWFAIVLCSCLPI